MSLVQAFIYKDFILVCGEQRAELDNGKILEHFIKVRKLNETTIIGMTGTIEGNFKLFSDYIQNDFTLKETFCTENYLEIENKVLKNFHENFEYLQTHSIHSVICGWDGNNMTGKAFFTKDTSHLHTITDISPEFSGQVRFVNCGLNEHYVNAERIRSQINPNSILQFKNLFKEVIFEGIKFDNTINKNITFEKIRRIDIK